MSLDLKQTIGSMICDANAHGVIYSHVTMDRFLNPIGEDDVVDDVDLSAQEILIAALEGLRQNIHGVSQKDEKQMELST